MESVLGTCTPPGGRFPLCHIPRTRAFPGAGGHMSVPLPWSQGCSSAVVPLQHPQEYYNTIVGEYSWPKPMQNPSE
ncbi:hypothetical protein UPYG_G00034980 [Umbra pygmaea]|uniref:Uncharacterized protein n=1 Tax=Umbra pygmaea TaxID=75934 RepID=A0ABD0XNL8_UMBPY